MSFAFFAARVSRVVARSSQPLLLAALLGLGACQSKEPAAATEKLPDLQKVHNLTPSQQLREVSAAIDQDPANAALYQRRTLLNLTLRHGPAAVADAEQFLRLDGPKAPNYLLRAKAYFLVGNLKKAQADADEAADLSYDGADLPQLQGELAFVARRYQPAIEYFNEVLKKSPFEERAYYYKGMVYLETGDTTRAISNFQTATEQAPTMADAYSQLASIYNARRDFATARQYISAGLRTSPDDGSLYYNAAVGQALQARLDSALQLFTKAARLDTTQYLAHFNAAYLHYQRDEFALAVPHLRAVLRQAAAPPPNTRLLLADCLDRLGQYRAAAAEYARVAQAQPDDARLAYRVNAARARLRQQQADSLAGRPGRVIPLDSLRKIR